ncbi:MAG: hypothetical protein ACLTTU_10375 [Bilophila wadsworthia]
MTLAMGQRTLAAADIIRRDAGSTPSIWRIWLRQRFHVPAFLWQGKWAKSRSLAEIDEHSAEARGHALRAFLTRWRTDAARGCAPAHAQDRIRSRGDRVLYLPHAANGMAVWAAALRAHGINAKLLPPPDERSLEWGRRCLDGKECLPCTLMTGDMVRLIKEDGVDPAKAAFFMPGSCGSCRYDLFNTLQQIVFEDMGLGGAALVDEYQGANRKLHAIMSGASCGMLAWRGFIAADILEKLRLHIRPYETGAGDTDRAYYACLDRLVEVVEAKGDVERAVIGMVEAMRAVPVDRSRPRPLIGLVGEAYLRNVDYASNNIIQSVEQMGGEIRMPAIMEVLWYSLYKQRYFQELGRHRVKAFIHRVQHGILNRIERKMRRHAASVLRSV